MRVIENILTNVKKSKISKSTDESFSPLYQLMLSISQNGPVQLVPCFILVHYIFNLKTHLQVINVFFFFFLKKKKKKLGALVQVPESES